MPGSILGISVKVGDQVKKDQVLVILEAMKMENEIVSPVDGKVVSLGVSKGDSVNAGNVLLANRIIFYFPYILLIIRISNEWIDNEYGICYP